MSQTMRPFKALLSKEEALARLLSAVAPLTEVETLPLVEATNRVVAEDVAAPMDVPAFTRSAMDGYAVRAQDTFGASRFQKKRLRVVGVIHAGEAPPLRVGDGEAVQIATGGKLPEGADAVVRVENTDRDGDDVLSAEALPPGANVSRRGNDIAHGSRVVREGDVLTPARVGLLASLGLQSVNVYRRARVAVLPTGNEVAQPGQPLKEGQVYNSNSFALEALFGAQGARVDRFDVVADTIEAHEHAILREAADADLVVLSGGSSVGERDILVDVLRKNGDVLVHGVQVKPGKPLLVGKLASGTVVIGLPGYPTSCLTNAYIFGLPALRKLMRVPESVQRTARLPLGEKLVSNLGRFQFLPVRVQDGKVFSTFKESGALTSLSEADGYIGIPDNVDLVDVDEEVEVTFW